MNSPHDNTNATAVTMTVEPKALTATETGTGVDLAGYYAAAIAFSYGLITDGTFTPDIEDSPDNSVWTNVAAEYLIGTPAARTTANDHATEIIGYIGMKRYVRANITVAGATTGGVMSAAVIQQNPRFDNAGL